MTAPNLEAQEMAAALIRVAAISYTPAKHSFSQKLENLTGSVEARVGKHSGSLLRYDP